MKKLDLTLGYILLAICAFFLVMTIQLPPDARIYPMFIILLLALLTILHLFLTYKKDSKDKASMFDRIVYPQLIFVTVASAIYIAVMGFLGYITTTILYVATVLLGLKENKIVSIIVSVAFTLIVYVLFRRILNVPLPKGILI